MNFVFYSGFVVISMIYVFWGERNIVIFDKGFGPYGVYDVKSEPFCSVISHIEKNRENKKYLFYDIIKSQNK